MIAANRRFGLTVVTRWLAMPLALVAFAGVAAAAPQSSDQQRCLNHLTKTGADVVKHQGKSNWKCVHNATRGQTDKLGDPGETLTAQACLTNDVGGQGRQEAAAHGRPGARSLSGRRRSRLRLRRRGGDQRRGERRGAADRRGDLRRRSRCRDRRFRRRSPTARNARKKSSRGPIASSTTCGASTRGGVQDALKGRNRRAGAAPDLPAHSSDNLQGEILAQSFDDPKGKIQDEVDRLASKAQARCAAATTPIAQMFPGAVLRRRERSPPSSTASTGSRADTSIRASTGIYAMSVACDLDRRRRARRKLRVAGAAAPSARSHGVRTRRRTRIGRIQALGLNGYIDEQLDSGGDRRQRRRRRPRQHLSEPGAERRRGARLLPARTAAGPARGMEGGIKNDVWKQMEESEIYRAVASRRQLEAVLVDFWFNHYNVTGSDGTAEVEHARRTCAIRSAPGCSATSTRASCAWRAGRRCSTTSISARTRSGFRPARDTTRTSRASCSSCTPWASPAPYTEDDVKEVARALTGWREEWNNEANFEPGYPGFRYQNNRHDYLGPKTVLGQVIDSPADGEQEGFDAIALAATPPEHGDASSAASWCGVSSHEEPPFALVDALRGDVHRRPGRRRPARAGRRGDPEVEGVPALPGVPPQQGEAAGRPDAEPAARDRRRSGPGRRRLSGRSADARRSGRAHPQRRSADRLSGRSRSSGPARAGSCSASTCSRRRRRPMPRAGAFRVRRRTPTSSTTSSPCSFRSPACRRRRAPLRSPTSTRCRATDAQKVEQAGAFLLSSREFLTH